MADTRIRFSDGNVLLEQELKRCKTKKQFLEFLKVFPVSECATTKKRFLMYQNKARELKFI